MEIKYPDGATPLDPNEIDGLLLTHITTQNEFLVKTQGDTESRVYLGDQ